MLQDAHRASRRHRRQGDSHSTLWVRARMRRRSRAEPAALPRLHHPHAFPPSLSFLRAAVYSMYVGEGERIVRDVFMRARRAAPAVVLLDEIDGIASRRAARPIVTPLWVSPLAAAGAAPAPARCMLNLRA